MTSAHIEKVGWNVKSGEEDRKLLAPESEGLKISNGKACPAPGAVIQTDSHLFI